MTEQKIYISTFKTNRAVRDKDELDCLAFCVMGKLMFGCSIMTKTTARNYKRMFRMGTERFSRILGNCIKRGYVTDRGTHYFFNPIKEAKAQNAVIELPRAWGRGNEKRSAITLNQAKDYIRKIVQYDKIDKKGAIENALKAKADTKTLKSYRKAQRLCSRISNKPVLRGRIRGTSMTRVAKNMNTYKAKARKLMREMVADGWIFNTPVTIKTNFRMSQLSEVALKLIKRMGWHGSYFRLGHDIFCRVANIYSLLDGSKLRYFRAI